MEFKNELGTRIANQAGEQVIHGDLNLTYIGFNEHEKLRDQCLRDLVIRDPRDMRDDLKRKKGDRATGTCEWFLNSSEIMAWRDVDSAEFNTFWLSGNPGTGKSTLAIHLVDVLEASFSARTDSCVIFFFCDTSAHYQNTAIAVLRGLVYQLCRWSKYLLDKYLLLEYRVQGPRLFDSFAALWRVFQNMSTDSSCGHVYVIVDALDECDDESQRLLLQSLERSYKPTDYTTNIPCFRFLITSRPYQRMFKTLSKFPHKDLSSFPEVERDINTFIDETVLKLAHMNYPPKLQREAAEIFKTKAECTFLWIGLAYAEIKDLSVRDGIAQLRGLPVGLEKIYQSLLLRALEKRERGTGDRTEIVKMLTTVAVALEPLSPKDLVIACSLFEGEDFDTRVQFVKDTVAMCGFMIIVADGYVRTLHKTVKDFIFKRAGDIFPPLPEVHAQLASTCVDRLLEDFREQRSVHVSQRNDAFVVYSVRHWPSHAHLALDHYAVKLPEQAEFFSHNSESRDAWLTYALALGEDISTYFSLFHVAARWDVVPLLDHTTSESFLNVSEANASMSLKEFVRGFKTFRGNPLEAAASSDNVRVFEQLLQLKAVEHDKRVVLNYESDPEFEADRAFSIEHGYRFQVTPRVIKMIVRNQKIAAELLNILWNQRRKELKLDHDVVIDMVRFLSADDSVVSLMFNELTVDALVDRAILNAAAANERSSKRLLGMLVDLRGKYSQIGQDVVFAAAQQFDASILQKILRDCKVEITWTPDLVMAAATNKAHAPEIMSFLRQTIPENGLQYSQSFKEHLFGNSDLRTIQEILNFNTLKLNERLMCACARNTRSGHGIIRELLKLNLGDHVTESVLLAAASNQDFGQAIIESCLEIPKARSSVTPLVLEALLENHWDSFKLATRLLDCLEANTVIPDSILHVIGYHKGTNQDVFEQFMAKLFTEHALSIAEDAKFAAQAILNCRAPLRYFKILVSEDRSIDSLDAALTLVGKSFELTQEVVDHIGIDDNGWEVLIHSAVKDGRSDLLQSLVFHCEDTAQKDSRLAVTACAAAEYGQTEVLRLALDEGVDINTQSGIDSRDFQRVERSLLERAFIRGKLGAFNLLLENGVNVKASGILERSSRLSVSLGFPPTMLHPEHLRTFIDRIVCLDTEAQLRKQLLRAAIWYGDLESVHSLIDSGIGLKSDEDYLSSPILHAVGLVENKNAAKMVALLLDKGADSSTQEALHKPVAHAMLSRNMHAAQILLRRGAALPSISSSIFGISGITYLLRHGVILERHTESAATERPVVNELPMDLGACQNLYDAGWNFSSRDRRNRTMLMQAILKDLPNHVKWLLSIGVDINAVDEFGYSALHYSVQRSLVTTQILCHAGADLRHMSGRGETWIHCAAASGKVDVLRWMIGLSDQDSLPTRQFQPRTSGALSELLDKTDHLHRTALHLALRNNHVDVVELLRSEGARIDTLDHDGSSAQAPEPASLEIKRLIPQLLSSGPHSVSTQDIEVLLNRVRRSIFSIDGNFPGCDEDRKVLSEELVKHQLFEEARTACEIRLQREDLDVDSMYLGSACTFCAFVGEIGSISMKGIRFFQCKTCGNRWLCERCWYRRWSLPSELRCFDHVLDYMQIPGPGWRGFESDIVNGRGETEKEWIQRLCEMFGVGETDPMRRKRGNEESGPQSSHKKLAL